MNITLDRCALTGYPLDPQNIEQPQGPYFEYETEFVGKVKVPISSYGQLLKGNYENFILAGICKQRTLENQEPIMLDTDFITRGYKELHPPLEFEEKCSHFLKYIFKNGGRENHEFEFNSTKDFALAYSSQEEFKRIIEQLKQDYYISVRKDHRIAGGANLYLGVTMTNVGKEQARKELPQIPMFGLVSQHITTGDAQIDNKINHARQLFFSEPQSMENMRSACEALSYVLEPLRNNLSIALTVADINDFFKMVNTFDIRHNKDSTKNLIHPEQLEWIFYTLLNSINTYTKLKRKLSS